MCKLLLAGSLAVIALALLLAGLWEDTSIEGSSWSLASIVPMQAESWTSEQMTKGVAGTLSFLKENRFSLLIFGISVAGSYTEQDKAAMLTMEGTGDIEFSGKRTY